MMVCPLERKQKGASAHGNKCGEKENLGNWEQGLVLGERPMP